MRLNHDRPMFARVNYPCDYGTDNCTLFVHVFVVRHQMTCCRFLCFFINLTCGLLKNYTIPQQLWMTMTFWCTFQLYNIESPDAMPPFRAPLPLGFTVVSDHPKAGELLTWIGLQSGAVPVRIPISFLSRALQIAGGGRSSVGSAPLALSKWTDVAALFWANPETVVRFKHTWQMQEW